MVEFLLLRKGKFLNYALTFIGCFFLVTTGWGQTETTTTAPNLQAYAEEGLTNPTVTSDKDDYAPGETAIITGTGWTLDSTVDIHLEEEPAHDHHHGYHGTVVDENGNWRIDYPIEERHLGVKFTVIVDGVQSKYQGLAYFTDAQDTQIALSSSKSPSTQGESITFTTAVTRNNTSNTNVVGTLYLYVDDVLVQQTNVTPGNNVLTYTTSTLSEGNHTIRTEFVGSASSPGYNNSSIVINQVVNAPACNAPVLTVPNNITKNTESGGCGAIVTYSASATGSPAPEISYVFSGDTIGEGSGTGSGSTFSVGETTVTVTASNSCGTDIESFVVTVVDNQNPTITAPAAVTVSANASCQATGVELGSATTADNCSVASVTNDAPETFPLGNTTVTWTVTDGAGLTATATQIVTVVDNQNPTITAPAAVTVSANASCQATGVELGSATTADNCSVASVTNDAPDTFPLGNTTVTWTVTDGAGLTATATQIVTVEDTTAPNITAPLAVTVSANASCQAIGVELGSATTADNCSVASVTNNAPDTFPLGNTTVTWTVTDGAGLTATATQIVTVEDTTAPTITAPIAVTVSANASCQATGVELGSATTADNCSVASVTNNAPDTFPLGNTTVTWTVTDGAGLTATATQIVTVEDTTAPTITAPIAVTVSANASCQATGVELGSATTADNCSVASVTNNAPDTFPLGNTTVTWTVTDGAGLTATAEQTVTVQDNIAPTVVTQNITVQLDENGSATITASLINNGSTDNCEIASYALDITSFDCSNVGANTVELTVTDVNGNSSSGTATVTVQDNVAPTVVSQNITVQLDENGSATITAAQINNGSTDNCEIASYALDITSLDCSNVGANTVELTVTDVNGNSSSGTATVTVQDNVAPTVVTQNITVQLDENGSATITAAQINNVSTDNCEIASYALDITSFDCFNVGANTVELTVTDVNGNSASANATVTVEDNIAPIITTNAKDSTVESDGQGNEEDFQVWLDNNGGAVATDNCSDVIWTYTYEEMSDGCGTTGSTEVTFLATDGSGNTSTTKATFTIKDETAPEVADIITPIDPVQVGSSITVSSSFVDSSPVTATWYFSSDGNFTDEDTYEFSLPANAANGSISNTFTSQIFSTADNLKGTGVYGVQLVVVDACGNQTIINYDSFLVVYDPSGGFVTGGGWITSPIVPGVEYMGVTGKANFGFNAKYKTGKNNLTEVDGNTNFQFKEGDFHFKSIAHENMSLVISGNHKATYRGLGTVNGTGSHYFIVTVIDGDASGGGGADKFRITVFPNGSTSPSGQPIYDNEYGVAANADATTVLGGGSIVIHKPKSAGTKMAETTEKLGTQTVDQQSATLDILGNLAVAPNPVRTEAAVRFSVIEDANITLRIFDFNGREVNRLFQGALRANEVKEVTFQRNNLMSGIYIVKLTTDRGHSYDKQIIVE